MLDLNLALERVLTGGGGSGVLSLFAFLLRDEGVLWPGVFSSAWPFCAWDPATDPFGVFPFVKPFDVAAGNRLGDGGVSPVARIFLADGSGDRRGGE